MLVSTTHSTYVKITFLELIKLRCVYPFVTYKMNLQLFFHLLLRTSQRLVTVKIISFILQLTKLRLKASGFFPRLHSQRKVAKRHGWGRRSEESNHQLASELDPGTWRLLDSSLALEIYVWPTIPMVVVVCKDTALRKQGLGLWYWHHLY